MAVEDGDVIQVTVSIDLTEAVVAQNIFYWRLVDPIPDNPTAAQIIAVLDTKLTAMYNDIAAYIADEVLVDEFDANKIEWNVDYWETVETLGGAPLAVAGTAVQDQLPHGVAAVVTANTSRPQTRARKFFPGFGEDTVEESTWTGAALTALAALIVEWLTDQGVTGSALLEPVVVGQSGPSAGLIYALISAAASGIAGYQRRRKPGVGT